MERASLPPPPKEPSTAARLVLIGLVLLLIWSLLVAWPRMSHAGASCEFIKDPDKRHYCRALSDRKPSECEFIKDHDLRTLCRVQTKK